jgi:hypothetical protein
MTVYARGYRPMHREWTRKGPRFLPIWREGVRDAVKGRGFFWMRLFVLMIVVLLAFLLYFQANILNEAQGGSRHAGGAAADKLSATAAREALQGALFLLHAWSFLFVVLATLFVAAGLVADDLRERALPLYLVRPITPLDYYLGKVAIPVTVLAQFVLAPGILLVVLAGFFRPSGETTSFLLDQVDLVGGLLLHFLVVALSYSSLVLIFSCWSRRRLTATILGGVTLIGAQVIREASAGVEGTAGDVLRAISPAANGFRILQHYVGGPMRGAELEALPTLAAAWIATGLLALLGAWVVTRRARTTEVVA